MAQAIVVTDEMRTKVEECARAGFNITHVSTVVGCTPKTFNGKPDLMRIYTREKYKILKKISDSAFQKALDGDEKMQMFLLKTQLNFSEQTYVKLKDFAGKTYTEQKLAIETMLEEATLSIENYQKLMNALNASYQPVDIENRLIALEKSSNG